jgi:glutathione S-transferase
VALTLVIGNKNYSSWSMRPWVLMTQLGIAFTERRLRFDFTPDSDFYREVARVSPAGQVPVLLLDDGFAVWDTLAIVETLHERFPEAGVWPADPHRRARARSLCAQMHSGFGTVRRLFPMNIEAALPEVGARLLAEHAELRAQVTQVEELWARALAESGGPFLFGGAFGAADAMYAPMAMRFRSYAPPLAATSRAYLAALERTPGVAAWITQALAERDFLDFEEPYRSAPGVTRG